MTAQRAHVSGAFAAENATWPRRPIDHLKMWMTVAGLGLVLLVGCGQSDSVGGPISTMPAVAADDLAFADESNDESKQALESGDDSGTTAAASGLPPVTTVPGRTDGSLDGYTGVIGWLAPDASVTDPVAAPPARRNNVQPLTGLPGEVADRPAAVVKIDNGQAAAPQTGLNDADIVIEEEVEGGVTRFAAIFHSNGSIVGPVRSGRTTDVALVSGLGSPLLLYSGANDLTETILRRQLHIQNRSFSTSSGYWRDESRRAPSNLYTDTVPHWASALGGPPPPHFDYRSPATSAEGETVSTFSINYPASRTSWEWSAGRWTRFQRGERHDLANGEPVTAANVVVIEAERVGTGMFDSAGGPVPEFVFVGSGKATVFTDGQRIEGVWTKPTLTSVATLTSPIGVVIELTPGRTWIQLVEEGSGYLQ